VTHADATAPFSLGDRDELRTLLVDAGFRDITIVARSIQARFATPDEFIARTERAYAAVVPTFATDAEVFAAFVDRISAETAALVADYRDGDSLVVPMHAHIAIGRT
jgi:hypothetical protein